MTNQFLIGAAVTSVFVVLFVAEKLFPLRTRTMDLLRRLWVNLVMSAAALATAMLVIKPLGLRVLNWSAEQPFGLLQWVPMPEPVRWIAGLLLLDLSFYYWHVVNHKIPLLWRFHNVHHIDSDLDVSTGFRFHFGEVLFSVFFRAAQLAITGVPISVCMVYEGVFQANTLFHHSNVRLPIRIERMLNLVLVTPRMHGIHHSQVEHETNSNFSVVFSWWDRLHRTLRLNVAQSSIVIGIAGYSDAKCQSITRSVLLPFQRQDDYWKTPAGAKATRDPSDLRGDKHDLAE
jgi:sterol desaturase/sphingolipid hydroxylase (fatty acid hydroxylase superfamily)